jgi:hypothetical protein
MAKTISTIQTLIESKINGLGLFKVVADNGEGNFAGYPAAVIMPTGGSGKTEDTAVNERSFTFEILCYQEQSAQATTKEDAADKMTQICDAIIEAFDTDPDLGREVMKVEVVDYSFDFKVQTGTWNFATFKINARVLVQHY